MKKINFLLLTTALLFATALPAQTVDEIVAKHIEAIGGKEKLSQAKSLYTENSMDIMGNQAPVTEYLVDGKGFKSETDFNGAKIINCYTDKGGWSVNPMAGVTDAQPMPDEMYSAGKSSIYIGGVLADYAAKGNKVELLGKEDNNYKLKVTTGNSESIYFIDASSYYITKTTAKGEMMGQPTEIVVTFSEHKKTDFGIVLPYTRSVDFGTFAFSLKVNKVEVNKEIDPKIFELPK
ncbi:MAG TPA: hypothetical protein VIZ28_17090 [Chitinophagaceae bacterium]